MYITLQEQWDATVQSLRDLRDLADQWPPDPTVPEANSESSRARDALEALGEHRDTPWWWGTRFPNGDGEWVGGRFGPFESEDQAHEAAVEAGYGDCKYLLVAQED